MAATLAHRPEVVLVPATAAVLEELTCVSDGVEVEASYPGFTSPHSLGQPTLGGLRSDLTQPLTTQSGVETVIVPATTPALARAGGTVVEPPGEVTATGTGLAVVVASWIPHCS